MTEKSVGCSHTPVCLASLTPRIDYLFHSQLLADAAVSGTAAHVPPAALPSAGRAQPPHASLLPVGTKSF